MKIPLPSLPVFDVDFKAATMDFFVISRPFLFANKAFNSTIFCSFIDKEALTGFSEMVPVKGKGIFSTFSYKSSGVAPIVWISCWTDLARAWTLTKLSFNFVVRVLIKILEGHISKR